MRSILTVIPARSGSKGVPNKNIREICGKPLIAWAIEKAGKVKSSKFIVSTDCVKIASIAKSHGAEVPFLRPQSLSSDKASLLDVMRHALCYYDEIGEHYDAVLSLQVTTPILSVESINEGINLFHEKNAMCVVSVSEMRQGHPLLAKKMSNDGVLHDFWEFPASLPRYPRQLRVPSFYASGGFFLRDRRLIMNNIRNDNGFGDHPYGVLVSSEESVNIDEAFDFEIASLLLERKMNNECFICS